MTNKSKSVRFPIPLLSIKRASYEFDIPENTLRSMIRNGEIRVYKRKGKGSNSMVRIARRDLEDLFEVIPSINEMLNIGGK